jgi:integrase/recombinase XerD
MVNGSVANTYKEYMLYLVDKRGVSSSTASAYKTDLRRFVRFLKDRYSILELSDLNQSVLMSFVLYLKNEGKKSSSITRSMSVIKNYLHYAYMERLMEENLSELKIEIPQDEKKLPEVLTVEEVNKLLSIPDNSILGYRDKAMLETLYTSGLKVNELISLKLSDIDMKLKVLKCHSRNKERVLPLGAIAYDAISNYLSYSRNELQKEHNEFLFLSYNGQKISRQGFWKLVKKYATQAGIEKNISTSTFRHTFATHMIQNGIHKEVLKDALGNSSVASVQVYLDLNRKRNPV